MEKIKGALPLSWLRIAAARLLAPSPRPLSWLLETVYEGMISMAVRAD